MVAFKIVLRLLSNIFLQWPLQFSVPELKDDLTGEIAIVTGGEFGAASYIFVFISTKEVRASVFFSF